MATAAAAQPRAKAEAAAAPAAAAAAAAAQLEQAAAAAHRLLTHQEYSAPATPVTQARALLSLLLQSPATATTAQHLHTDLAAAAAGCMQRMPAVQTCQLLLPMLTALPM